MAVQLRAQDVFDGRAFGDGERLEYAVSYKVSFVMTDVAEVIIATSSKDYKGQQAFQVDALGKTYPFYRWFFDLNDQYVSILDSVTLRPLELQTEIREGKYRYSSSFVYDWDQYVVNNTFRNHKNENSNHKQLKLIDGSYDALALAVAGGTLLERLHMEKHVEQFVFSAGSIDIESPELTRRERVRYAREQAVSTFKKVAPYILVGVGLGAVIHNWIPESWIETVLGGSNPFGVVLAVLVGVPMYADIFGTIPVAEALLAKGAQLGTVLTFMMAVTTLSLPSMIMLRKAVKPRLLGLFIAICTSGIILIGYLFNVFQFYLISI